MAKPKPVTTIKTKLSKTMLSDWQDLKGKTLTLNVFEDMFLSVFFHSLAYSAPAVAVATIWRLLLDPSELLHLPRVLWSF